MAKKQEIPQQASLPMSAAGRYSSLESLRWPYLMRGRDVSALSIPSLLPPQGATGTTKLYTPYQSVGAEGVNNLAAKLLLALFPPGTSFFRLTIDDFVVAELEEKAGSDKAAGDAKEDLEEALAKVEKAVCNRLEQKGSRSALFEALKHLIVAGNVLLFVDESQGGKVKFYRLDKFVVKRDVKGQVTDIIVEDDLSYMTLPESVRALVDKQQQQTKRGDRAPENVIKLYTRICLKGDDSGDFEVYQEVNGTKIPGTDGVYKKDHNPWIPVRWTRVDGEDYGRGLGEHVLGDLQSLERLMQAIVEFAAAASKILFLVASGGSTNKRRLARAKSGAFLDGNSKDVTVMMLDKTQDFRVVKETADVFEKRLERQFLLLAGSQRDAERVTAEEIRLIAQELESALGGVYSIFAQELQRPLADLMLWLMQKEGKLPRLPKEAVAPAIVTGLEALGRGSDLAKLDQLIQGTAQELGPAAVAEYVNPGALIRRRATALGIDIPGLIRSDEEVAANQQNAQQQTLLEKGASADRKAAGDERLAAAKTTGATPADQ